MPFKLQKKIIYFSIIILYLALSFSIYKVLYTNKQAKEKFIVNVVHEIIQNLIVKELKDTLIDIHSKKKIFKSVRISDNKSSVNRNTISQVNPYAIIIEGNNEKITLYLQDFKETIDKLIPPYISYKLSLNSKSLATSQNYNQDLTDKREYLLDDKTIFNVALALDKNSKYRIEISYIFYKYLIASNMFLLVVLTAIAYFFKKFLNHNNDIVESLSAQLKEISSLNQDLLRFRKVDSELNSLFISFYENNIINRLTSILTNEQIHNKYKFIDGDFFPIKLKDESILYSEICIEELCNYIEGYFIPSLTNKLIIQIKTDLVTLDVPCAKAIFYQIILSLIYNIKVFVEEQSSKQRILNVFITESAIKFSYTSFPLNEEKMISLSKKILSSVKPIFMLDCESIFKSLKENGFKYNLRSINKNENIIEINLNIDNLVNNVSIIKFPNKNID